MTDVAVVGMGPWGLAVLERLVTGAIERGPCGPALTVHVVEPGTPGSGVFGGPQPDYLILNTPCGQHSLYPFPAEAVGRPGTGFYEWAVATGYRWVDDRCEVTAAGRPISPHDFLPRRLMGEYLAWFYQCLVEEAPPELRVVHHPTSAVGLLDAGDCELLHLADGTVLPVDHVMVTTGHTPNVSAADWALPPYPVTELQDAVPPGALVGIQGMGLVALDVVIALTQGRGGRFVRRDGRLHYRPSGQEPRIALFSRSGYPYCAKSIGTADITEEFQPVICTPAAVAALGQSPGGRRRIDARAELLPLILAEMTTAYYAQSARLSEGTGAATALAVELAGAWRAGTFATAVEACAESYGPFDAAAHLFVGEGERFVSAKDYQARVAEMLGTDVAEARVPNGASPLKVAYEVLRALRETMRSAVEFGRLTPASHRDFHTTLCTRVARIVAGPPVQRSEELVALIDAEVVRMPFGPSPDVEPDGDGVVISSRYLDRPHRERVDRMVAAHIDQPTMHDSASPLLRHLYGQGRVRQLEVDGEELGSIQLTDDFHPVNTDGAAEERLWFFGAPTEGTRYFTAYVPSPAIRVRAFLDAGVCADRILEDARRAEAGRHAEAAQRVGAAR